MSLLQFYVYFSSGSVHADAYYKSLYLTHCSQETLYDQMASCNFMILVKVMIFCLLASKLSPNPIHSDSQTSQNLLGILLDQR